MDRDGLHVLEWTETQITERPGAIIVTSLLLTGGFLVGLGGIETAAGTDEFTQDLPAEAALQAIDREFGPTFAPGQGSTQLIQRGGNVLAKPALLRMLEVQKRASGRSDLRVSGTTSVAGIVANRLDPSAEDIDEEITAIERATPREIRVAVRESAAADPDFETLLSRDFNRREAAASATIALISHELPAEVGQGAGTGEDSPMTPIQRELSHVADSTGGPTEIAVFGSGIIAAEFGDVIGDTLRIVIPAALVLIILFLVIAFRDPIDLLIAIVALVMALVWTFGFLGLAGIPFNQILITVPIFVLAIGIDYGIHVVNRYREERIEGGSIERSMRQATDQLLVAFCIVTATTVAGFLSNLTSELSPLRDFGVVASVGIVFTLYLFGVFVPATKVVVDRFRDRRSIPAFSRSPLGSDGTRLGGGLQGGVVIARHAPVAFLVMVMLLSAASGVYATDVDTSFSEEDFLPPAERPGWMAHLPGPIQPGEYAAIGTLEFLEENFAVVQGDTVTVYVQGPLESDHALVAIDRASQDPPGSFIADGREARADSIVSVIRSRAAVDPEFRALVERNDRTGDGIPEDNLGEIYDALFDSPAREQARAYLTDSRRSTRIVYQVDPVASQEAVTADARTVADRHRFHAVATGGTVVFQAVTDVILRSATVALAVALSTTVALLILMFGLVERRPSLGIANAVPILVTVAILAGSMRLTGLGFNAFTATILALTIGLGIDYSVHITHRFIDEFNARDDAMAALEVTVRGTGGALTGTMLTTVAGVGVLVLGIFPVIGQFGILTGLAIVYSYLTAVVVLPPTLLLWSRWTSWWDDATGARLVGRLRGSG